MRTPDALGDHGTFAAAMEAGLERSEWTYACGKCCRCPARRELATRLEELSVVYEDVLPGDVGNEIANMALELRLWA